MSRSTVKTILILTANPKNTTPLRLGEEVRDISDRLRLSQHRDAFRLEQRWATRPRDIQLAMLEVQPQIVQFSGHGTEENGLAFEDESGQVKFVNAEALAGQFELFADQVECVVLNACSSDVQAEAIAQHIPYVIGMIQNISDRAALEFLVGFYDAIGAGRAIDFAYKLGCSAMRMAGIPETPMPFLKQKPAPSSFTSAHQSPAINNLSASQRRRLEQQRNSLQPEFDIRNQKLKQLRASWAIETGAAIKFQLQQQIQEEETKLAELSQKLDDIDRAL